MSEEQLARIKATIRTISNFPKPGVEFRDVTTLLGNAQAFAEVTDLLAEQCQALGATTICAVEARGYIFGAPVAYKLGLRFVPVRKPGKLPAEVIRQSYSLEYGENVLELHKDSLNDQDRVIIIDDLVATGGSAKAAAQLVERLGAKVVGMGFVVELPDLGGRETLKDYKVFSLLEFAGE